MHDNDRISLFNRFVGRMAWLVFWAIMGSISLALRFYYRFVSRARKPAESSVKPLKVAFCENGAGYGGAIISLAAFLEKIPDEFEPFIYTSLGSDDYKQLSRLGKWRHTPPVGLLDRAVLKKLGLPLASFLDNLFNLLPYAFSYFVAFRRDGIGCVYLNNDASCNFAAAIAAKFARLPLVLHARGFNADTSGNRWVLSKLDHCIAVSTAVQAELLTLGVPPLKCSVIPEGLDLTVFHPKSLSNSVRDELKLPEDSAVITLVGGLVDWKGQDVLLDAAPLIFQQFPNAVILLIGAAYGKSSDFANMIIERAKSPVMQSRVYMLGARNDIADILACSDVVVHASTKPEPFGRTFLEGMALGKAVIASNEGGPLDVISDRVDGILIEPRSPSKLADAINLLLRDPAFSAKLGQNAAEEAKNYSIESHAHSISAVLQMVCGGIGPGLAPEIAVPGTKINFPPQPHNQN